MCPRHADSARHASSEFPFRILPRAPLFCLFHSSFAKRLSLLEVGGSLLLATASQFLCCWPVGYCRVTLLCCDWIEVGIGARERTVNQKPRALAGSLLLHLSSCLFCSYSSLTSPPLFCFYCRWSSTSSTSSSLLYPNAMSNRASSREMGSPPPRPSRRSIILAFVRARVADPPIQQGHTHHSMHHQHCGCPLCSG